MHEGPHHPAYAASKARRACSWAVQQLPRLGPCTVVVWMHQIVLVGRPGAGRLHGIVAPAGEGCCDINLRPPGPRLPPALQFALRGFGLSAYEALRKHNVRVRNEQPEPAGRQGGARPCTGLGLQGIAECRGPLTSQRWRRAGPLHAMQELLPAWFFLISACVLNLSGG